MDIYNWNWGVIAGFTNAIATLLTGLIALLISSQWKKKKRSEILSNEAAKILVILGDYEEILIYLDSEMMKPSKSDNRNKLEELNQIAHQLISRATLFGELATKERDVTIEIKNIAAKLYNRAKNLDDKSFKDIRDMKGNSTDLILISEFNDAIEQPKAIMINYFKHQKAL